MRNLLLLIVYALYTYQEKFPEGKTGFFISQCRQNLMPQEALKKKFCDPSSGEAKGKNLPDFSSDWNCTVSLYVVSYMSVTFFSLYF